MLTDVTEPPFCDVAKTAVPAVFEARVTVVAAAAEAGLPEPSCNWTVMGPRFADAEDAPATAAEAKASLLAAAAVIVSCCEAEVSPAADTVTLGVPALVSP
jgi:hypothetical protein